MKQVTKIDHEIDGGNSDSICICSDLAKEAWGKRCEESNSSLIAMAYLWRRFGPPWAGCDDYKELCSYILTTEDPRVFLWLHLKGCGLVYSVGYMAHTDIKKEINKPVDEWVYAYEEWWTSQHPEIGTLEDTPENREFASNLYWKDIKDIPKEVIDKIGERPDINRRETWRENDGLLHHVNQAILDAMKELLRPVYIRDCPINIFGRCEDDFDHAAEPSKYAGLGVPLEAMEEMLKDDNDG